MLQGVDWGRVEEQVDTTNNIEKELPGEEGGGQGREGGGGESQVRREGSRGGREEGSRGVLHEVTALLPSIPNRHPYLNPPAFHSRCLWGVVFLSPFSATSPPPFPFTFPFTFPPPSRHLPAETQPTISMFQKLTWVGVWRRCACCLYRTPATAPPPGEEDGSGEGAKKADDRRKQQVQQVGWSGGGEGVNHSLRQSQHIKKELACSTHAPPPFLLTAHQG